MVLAFIVHKDAGNVSRVVEVAHRAEGNREQGIVVVIAALHLALVHAHYLKAQPGDADGLSQRRLSREKSSPRLVANYHHPRPLQLILFAQAAPRGHRKTADAVINGIDAGEEEISKSARVMLNSYIPLIEDRSHALNHRHFVAHIIDIRNLEANLAPRLCPSCLQRRSARKGSNYIGSPRTEDDVDRALNARAERQQNDDRGNPPRHTQHGERSAAAIVLHRVESFFQQIASHNLILGTYSWRKPSTGSSNAAWGAG